MERPGRCYLLQGRPSTTGRWSPQFAVNTPPPTSSSSHPPRLRPAPSMRTGTPGGKLEVWLLSFQNKSVKFFYVDGKIKRNKFAMNLGKLCIDGALHTGITYIIRGAMYCPLSLLNKQKINKQVNEQQLHPLSVTS